MKRLKMQSKLLVQIVVGVICAAGCGCEPSVAPKVKTAAVATQHLPDWSLTESESTNLGEPFSIPPYEIRPSVQFQYVKHDEKTKTYYWIGPVREDETYAQLIITVQKLTEKETGEPLPKLLDLVLGAIRQRRENWSVSRTESGKIHGLPFVRATWSGTASSAARKGLAGREMHGIVYLTVHNQQAIQIMCQDVAPDHAESLKSGELSARTFRVAAPEQNRP